MNPIKIGSATDFPRALHEVRATANRGRAVFALRDIPKHTVIVQSHAILLERRDCEKLGETAAWPYRFALGEQCALVFGDISFCNHSSAPNAKVAWTRLTAAAAVVSLVAVTDIAADAEIEIFYSDAEEYSDRGVVLS